MSDESLLMKQKEDEFRHQIYEKVRRGENTSFKVDDNKVIRLKGRICVPDFPDLKREVLDECHKSKLNIHPGVNKMYRDVKRTFWWKTMKRDISIYVSRCATCQ